MTEGTHHPTRAPPPLDRGGRSHTRRPARRHGPRLWANQAVSLCVRSGGERHETKNKHSSSPSLFFCPPQLQLAATTTPPTTIFPYSASYARTVLATILTRPDGGAGLAGEAAADGDASAAAPPPPSAPRVTVGGWVRAGREAGAGAFAFIELADGTCPGTLQVVVPAGVAEGVGGLKAVTPSGTSLLITGALLRCPPGTRQAVELKAETIDYVGACDNGKGGYPLAGKKRHTPEFLREVAHLRPRTALIGAVARVRSALAAATHAFFRQEGFQYVMTPIITAADCEGAGEMFQVTTLLTQADADAAAGDAPSPDARASLRGAADAAAEALKQLKAGKAVKAEVAAAVDAMLSARAAADAADERAARVGGLPRGPGGAVDYSRDFFGKAAYLTVSGQVREE